MKTMPVISLALFGLLSCGVLTDAAPTAPAKTAPAQSAVAAKTQFGTVAAADKSVTGALDAKALTDAKKLIGKMGSFQGTVASVYSPKNHGFVALDFAPDYHDALSARIVPDDYTKFPDLNQLEGKHIVVTGQFAAHNEDVQVQVTSPDQIKIIVP